MAAYASGRSGLAVRVQPGDRGGSDDFNQVADALAAGKRVFVDLLGGAAVYSGGAAGLADLVAGTAYPATTLVIADDAGNAWPFRTTTPTAIVFNVTGTAEGGARLYAVPAMLAGVSPAAADGRHNQVRFVADDEANPTPAHALLLGSGTITAGVFTAYSSAATSPATSLVAPKAHAASHKTGGVDELDVGGLSGLLAQAQTPLAHAASHQNGGADEISVAGLSGVLADAQMPLGHAASHAAGGSDPLSGYALLAADNAFAAAIALTNGRLRNARDARFGAPASGSHVAGGLWLDRAGAIWYCVADGTPGTWVQVSAGRAATWSGATADDITTAANWQSGALMTDYLVYDPTKRMAFAYNGAVWLGDEFTVSMSPWTDWVATGYSAGVTRLFTYPLSPLHDVLATAFNVVGTSTTADAANYWEFQLQYKGSVTVATCTKNAAGNMYMSATPSATVFNHATHGHLIVALTKTGSPAAITSHSASLTLRYVRR